jgi:hypothetical protein
VSVSIPVVLSLFKKAFFSNEILDGLPYIKQIKGNINNPNNNFKYIIFTKKLNCENKKTFNKKLKARVTDENCSFIHQFQHANHFCILSYLPIWKRLKMHTYKNLQVLHLIVLVFLFCFCSVGD